MRKNKREKTSKVLGDGKELGSRKAHIPSFSKSGLLRKFSFSSHLLLYLSLLVNMKLFEGPYAALLGSPQVVQMMQGNANSKLPPSDPRMHYRPILPEIGWYDPNLPQPRGWETFEQVPRFHPDARLPHPFGPQSYPRIHMESLRDFRIRTKPPAPWVDRLKVAVESELDWIKRYPGIEGGTLSEEEIAKGCGKVSLIHHL